MDYKRHAKEKITIVENGLIYNKWKFNNSIIGILTLTVSRKCDICLTNLQHISLNYLKSIKYKKLYL